MKSRTKRNKQNKYLFQTELCLIIYKTILEIIYLYNVSPAYSYTHMDTSINMTKFFVSFVFFLLTSIILIKMKDTNSKKILTVIYLFMYIPTSSYYWMSDESSIYLIYLTVSFLVVFLFSRTNIKVKQDFKTSEKEIVFIAFLSIIVISLVLIYKRGGIDPRAINFKRIYELRSEENIKGILGYLKNWIPKVLFPFLAAYFFSKKKYIYVGITLLLEVLLYFAFGNKAFILCVGWVFVCYFCARQKDFIQSITLLLSFLFIASFVLSEMGITQVLRDALPYRLIYIPSQIQFQYYDYFSIHDKLYYAEGFIGKIFGAENRFGEDVAFVIGRLYSNGSETHSNTGVFSDAYYNLGFSGMIITSILLGIILSIYNRFNKVDSTIIISSVSYIIFSLNDTGFQTTLLTGGMVFNLIILLLYEYAVFTPKKQLLSRIGTNRFYAEKLR